MRDDVYEIITNERAKRFNAIGVQGDEGALWALFVATGERSQDSACEVRLGVGRGGGFKPLGGHVDAGGAVNRVVGVAPGMRGIGV